VHARRPPVTIPSLSLWASRCKSDPYYAENFLKIVQLASFTAVLRMLFVRFWSVAA